MGPLISVPRAALERLLRESGSVQTPEQFVASQPESRRGDRYSGRIRAAAWSKNVLLFVTVFGLLIAVAFLDLENVVVLILLSVVTYFECRVYRYFIDGDERGPQLGFVNQACFAAGILVYGLAHAAFVAPLQIPAEYRDMLDADTQKLVVSATRATYLMVGIVGGVSQFALAWYYRNARAAA